jgi:hypothetical protein
MTRRYQVYDARGRPVDDDVGFDANGAIRDGYGMRVPLFMMDSTQKAIAADARRKKVTQYDPYGRVKSTYEEEEADSMMTDAELALHRPGYRTSTAVNDDAAVKAYRQYVADQANAWKKRDAQPPGSYPLSAGEGSACTVDGRPGTLVREGDWLVCRPTQRTDAAPTGPVFDAAEGQRIKDAAWEEMCQRQRDAWKTKP